MYNLDYQLNPQLSSEDVEHYFNNIIKELSLANIRRAIEIYAVVSEELLKINPSSVKNDPVLEYAAYLIHYIDSFSHEKNKFQLNMCLLHLFKYSNNESIPTCFLEKYLPLYTLFARHLNNRDITDDGFNLNLYEHKGGTPFMVPYLNLLYVMLFEKLAFNKAIEVSTKLASIELYDDKELKNYETISYHRLISHCVNSSNVFKGMLLPKYENPYMHINALLLKAAFYALEEPEYTLKNSFKAYKTAASKLDEGGFKRFHEICIQWFDHLRRDHSSKWIDIYKNQFIQPGNIEEQIAQKEAFLIIDYIEKTRINWSSKNNLVKQLKEISPNKQNKTRA